MSDTKESASGLSRRQFLRGSGAAAAATALTGVPVAPPTTQAAGGAGGGNVPAHGPAAVKINLNVNGRAMSTSDALDEIKRNAGTQFDPALVQIAIDARIHFEAARVEMARKPRGEYFTAV